MEVLEHQQERARRRHSGEERAHLREEVGLARRAVEAGNGRGGGEGLDAPADLPPGAVGRGLGPVVAVADEDAGARGRRLVADGTRKRGLADAGLAADQDQAAPPAPRRGQAVAQEGELAVAPDEGGGGVGADDRTAMRDLAGDDARAGRQERSCGSRPQFTPHSAARRRRMHNCPRCSHLRQRGLLSSPSRPAPDRRSVPPESRREQVARTRPPLMISLARAAKPSADMGRRARVDSRHRFPDGS